MLSGGGVVACFRRHDRECDNDALSTVYPKIGGINGIRETLYVSASGWVALGGFLRVRRARQEVRRGELSK